MATCLHLYSYLFKPKANKKIRDNDIHYMRIK